MAHVAHLEARPNDGTGNKQPGKAPDGGRGYGS
jgi:hypothetical protein